MNIDWEVAINNRRSIRSYEMRALEDPTLNLIKEFIDTMEIPFEHQVKIRLFKANPDKKLYTVFQAPPDGAAFISQTDICSISKAGFIGELFMLYATSLGLSTCWIGHYTLAELERVMPHLGENKNNPAPKWGYGKGEVQGERAICITPLGYWKNEGIRLVDRVQTSLFSFKRKPISTFLAEGLREEKLPPELLFAFDLARKAPSAANSQFWRFNVSSDFKVISISMPVGYEHMKWEHPNVDIGACASHFWLGLTLKNVKCQVLLAEDEGRAVWSFKII